MLKIGYFQFPPLFDQVPENVEGVKIGLMVCFDWVFPEVARSLALQGTDILCHPSNLVLAYCQQAMLTRCIENGVFAVTCNRFGSEDRPPGFHRAKPDRLSQRRTASAHPVIKRNFLSKNGTLSTEFTKSFTKAPKWDRKITCHVKPV
jgi:predicted amidohydrolase